MPKVSPNKTIEGSLGGLLFGVLLALLGGIVVEKFVKIEVNYGTLALWALMTSVVGQFGDLSMSVIKRICGIKDYGNLLPGHGGILDRFDSHLFAVPFYLSFLHIRRRLLFISAGGIIYEKYRAGIDIGSTTVKLVVLDDADEILYGEYRRHQAHTQETLSTLLEEAKKSVGECELQVCITGSGAINLGKALDISFVQEVVAVATALKNVRRRRMWRLNLAARMLRSYTLPAD